MKKLLLLLIPITLITLCGCSDKWYYATSEELSKEISLVYSTIDRNEALMNEKINDLLNTWIVEDINIKPDNIIYCHKHKDIKLWDNVYFAYLWNWDTDYLKNQEWIKTVRIDWVDWYYDIQPAVEILWEMVEWQNCITMINWYGTEPQKTYQDMINHIKYYIECSNRWCTE